MMTPTIVVQTLIDADQNFSNPIVHRAVERILQDNDKMVDVLVSELIVASTLYKNLLKEYIEALNDGSIRRKQ